MGFFDLPAPLFAWLDARTGMLLPPLIRLLLWGGIAGMVSILLYRGLSAQDRIRRGRKRLKVAQHALYAFDGPFSQAWPLMAEVVGLSLRQVARVAWPAAVAALPLVCLFCWMSTTYGYTYPPPGIAPDVHVQPADLNGQWVWTGPLGQDASPHIVVAGKDHRVVTVVAWMAAVPEMHKHRWWNALIGNPAGFLPNGGRVDRIAVALSPRQYLHWGPDWARGWELPFFSALAIVSLTLRAAMRIV
jgi:hypothetical protein